MTRFLLRGVFVRAVAGAVAGLVACGGESFPDKSVAPSSPSQTLARVLLAPRAVVLAVNGTHQLRTTSLAMSGDTISDEVSVTYASGDPEKVTVSSTGLIQGKAVTGSPVTVSVASRFKGITKTDYIYVSVVATTYAIDAMEFAPVTGAAVNQYVLYDLRFTNAGAKVDPIFARLEFLNDVAAANLYIGSMYFVPKLKGELRILATVNAFGRDLVDTLVTTVKNPTSHSFLFMDDFLDPTRIYGDQDGATLFLQPFGMLSFTSFAPVVFDITITDPDGIRTTFRMETDGFEMQMLSTPGLYTWETNTKPAMRGKILVE